MKKYLLSALAVSALLASCSKDATNVVVQQPGNTTPAFRVEGVSDVRYEKTPFSTTNMIYQYLNVIYGTGNPQNRVTLSVKDLPAGIQDSLSVRSGYPNFSTYLELLFNNTANGTYKPTVVATPDSGAAQNYPFTVTVAGDTSCDGYLTSNAYTTTSSCLGGTNYQVTLSKNGRMGDTFFVNNFRNTGLSLMVRITCGNTPSVIVPTQTLDGLQYSNNGSTLSTTGNFMMMLRTIQTDSMMNNTFCNYTLSRNN